MISRASRLMKDLSVAEFGNVQADPIPARAKTNSNGSSPRVCSATGLSETLSNWYLEKLGGSLVSANAVLHCNLLEPRFWPTSGLPTDPGVDRFDQHYGVGNDFRFSLPNLH